MKYHQMQSFPWLPNTTYSTDKVQLAEYEFIYVTVTSVVNKVCTWSECVVCTPALHEKHSYSLASRTDAHDIRIRTHTCYRPSKWKGPLERDEGRIQVKSRSNPFSTNRLFFLETIVLSILDMVTTSLLSVRECSTNTQHFNTPPSLNSSGGRLTGSITRLVLSLL